MKTTLDKLLDGLNWLEANPDKIQQYWGLLNDRLDDYVNEQTIESVLSGEYLEEVKKITARMGKLERGINGKENQS